MQAKQKTKILLLLLFIGANFYHNIFAQQNNQSEYPPRLEDAKEEVYKSGEDFELKVWIFNPQAHEVGSNKPAIVFFFGGGWRRGNPTQFYKHSQYLAARGMVAILADYRVSERHGVAAKYCVSDAKSVIRWVRLHAERLGVDPNRIVASGGSAGGHLAISTSTLNDFDEGSEDPSISSKPNAMVLFNPVLVLDDIPGKWEIPNQGWAKTAQKRLGTKPELLSPYHHIHSEMGPCIIFHGTADKTVPHRTAELFQTEMKSKNLRCELVSYKDEGHGFFNFGRNGNGPFIDTVNKLDAFLVSIGYLPAIPEVTVNK